MTPSIGWSSWFKRRANGPGHADQPGRRWRRGSGGWKPSDNAARPRPGVVRRDHPRSKPRRERMMLPSFQSLTTGQARPSPPACPDHLALVLPVFPAACPGRQRRHAVPPAAQKPGPDHQPPQEQTQTDVLRQGHSREDSRLVAAQALDQPPCERQDHQQRHDLAITAAAQIVAAKNGRVRRLRRTRNRAGLGARAMSSLQSVARPPARSVPARRASPLRTGLPREARRPCQNSSHSGSSRYGQSVTPTARAGTRRRPSARTEKDVAASRSGTRQVPP